ncbi:MAG: N-acetylneuraminate synthase family protein [Ignavibacteria bacterium]|nr:N-acetylneuraminate synthase family protein [Ignavibacteria bacterium]
MKNNRELIIGNRMIGDGHAVFVIAEIGINHNGSIDIAKQIIEGAKEVGCDAVKFQKRTPEICVPKDQWNIERDTPWGRMTYIDYRYKVEFGKDEYAEIDQYCKELGIIWFASCWDVESVEFIEEFDPVIYKTPSASLTDIDLLLKHSKSNKPVMISTGMSTMEEIETAIDTIGLNNLLIAHSTSSYPCKNEDLNLKMITTLREKYTDTPIGYSGHETGLSPSWAAVALGASFIERHITLDRAMWGTDQAASVEVDGFHRLVRNIRDIEIALGDGIKKVYDSELSARAKLRRVKSIKENI